jgi:hypothetical protein
LTSPLTGPNFRVAASSACATSEAPHVAGAEMRAVLRAKRDQEIAPRRLLEIDDRYQRALRERLGGDRRADAASPAGHQDMLSLDSSVHRPTRA